MRKLILLMLVILIALPAYAGLDFKDLKLNGHYRLRSYYIQNADNDQNTGDLNRYFRQRIWLGTEGNVAENIFFSATAEHEKEWGKTNAIDKNDNFALVYGYVKLSKLFDKDLTLTVGRQPYQLNKNNFVIWDNANGLDGMTLCYKNGNWDLDAMYLKVAENMTVGIKDIDDQEFYGVVANYKGFEGHKIQGYILLDRDAYGVAGGDESDLKQYVGIRAEGNVKSVPGLSYIGEYINLSGDNGQVNETDYKSSLLYAYAGYEFKDMKNFKILADYLWATGDEDPADDEQEAFQASSVAGNQMLEGNINFDFGMDAAKCAGVTYSNIKALGIGASVKPTDKLTLGAKYSMLEKDEGEDIGNNFDFYASYKMSDKYSLCAGYSMFDCDDEYKATDDKTDVLAAELRINF